MTHAEKIKLWMDDNDVTQETLGKTVGLSQPAVSNVLNRGAFPGAKNARALSRLMGCTMDWLFDESKSYPPPSPDSKAVVLTEPERIVLEFARQASVHDADPAALRSAIDRLNGTAFMQILARGATVTATASPEVGPMQGQMAGPPIEQAPAARPKLSRRRG